MIIEKIAIDLGSTNVLVYSKDNKKTIKESSIIEVKENKIYNEENLNDSSIKKIKIIKNGIITNLTMAILLIEDMIKRLNIKQILYRPQIYLSIPSEVTPVEKNIFKELIVSIGCNKINMYDEVLLSAIGCGADINNLITFIMNIGGETTNIGIISKGKIVNKTKLDIGGENFNNIFIQFIKDNYQIKISKEFAEKIKKQNINIYKPSDKNISIKGIDIFTSLPTTKNINIRNLTNIYNNIIDELVDNIKRIIETIPIEMSVKLIERGLIITGGGSLLKGLRETIEERINIPVYNTINPLNDTLEGLKIIMNTSKNRRL